MKFKTERILFLAILLALPAFPQTAVYPGSIATDANLKVLVNGVQTFLTASLTSAALSGSVTICTGIVPNTLATIDQEIIPVSTCIGTVITFGSRGFDGTTAAAHASGAPLSLFIDAWHHNSLRVEVEALETTLGANLSNVTASVNALVTSGIASQAVTLTGNQTIAGIKNFTGTAVDAVTFNSTATGSTAAVQQYTGTFQIFGDGDAAFQRNTVNDLQVKVGGILGVLVAEIDNAGHGYFSGATITGLSGTDGIMTVAGGALGGTANLFLHANNGANCWDLGAQIATSMTFKYSAACSNAYSPVTMVTFSSTGVIFAQPITATGLATTPGGNQPVCINTSTGLFYKGATGAC